MNILKIVSIVGARPQFVKCAPVSREIRKDHTETLVHTGQHYDPDMSAIFFQELEIPKPDYNLGIGSGSHGEQTGKMVIGIEKILETEHPDFVLVYGDTNSTLAGALAATKLHLPVAHVEAGLRSFDRTMPEEINRVLTDHISDLLFCPTQAAADNLEKEGINKGVHLTGDVMADALEYNRVLAEEKSSVLKMFGLEEHSYLVLTVHRPSNTDNKKNMSCILDAIRKSGKPTVFPVHPRTRKFLQDHGIWDIMPSNIILTEPLGYLDMIQLMRHAEKIITDSGGIQKEAYILEIPCITLRENTEWIETLEGNWNVLTGANTDKIRDAIVNIKPDPSKRYNHYPYGASKKIARLLEMAMQ